MTAMAGTSRIAAGLSSTSRPSSTPTAAARRAVTTAAERTSASVTVVSGMASASE